MNRNELRQLSTDRIEDARILSAASRWSAAYYLAGYSLECALKACVMAYIERTGIIFTEKKFAERCWTHDPNELVRLAGLEDERNNMMKANPQFAAYWTHAAGWSEAARYRQTARIDAETLFQALTDPKDGVLPWVRKHW